MPGRAATDFLAASGGVGATTGGGLGELGVILFDYLSYSMLNMMLRCPAQFERRYINGEKIPPGISARRGSGVHKAAEINHSQKIKTKKDMPTDALQDAARDHYIKLVKEEGVFIPKDQISEKSKLLGAGLDAAVTLTKLYRETLAPEIQPALVEERIFLDVGLEVPLSGMIDVLTIEDNLPDLKTADRAKNPGEANNSLQLTFYAGLVAIHIGRWPKELSLEVLINTKEPKLQSLKTTRGPEDWNSLMGRIQLMLAQVQTGLFPPCTPDSWVCNEKWCGYALTCKWYRRK